MPLQQKHYVLTMNCCLSYANVLLSTWPVVWESPGHTRCCRGIKWVTVGVVFSPIVLIYVFLYFSFRCMVCSFTILFLLLFGGMMPATLLNLPLCVC